MDLYSDELKLSLTDEKSVKLLSKIQKDLPTRIWDNSTKEQIVFRLYICRDCYEDNKCKSCGCNPLDTFSELISCNNGKRFPNLMNKWKWEEYKKINKIIFI